MKAHILHKDIIIKKIKTLSCDKTLINGSLFSVFSFFNRGVGFILLMLLANYIMPEEYGLLSLFTTLVMLLSYFTDLTTKGYLSISFFKSNHENFIKDFSSICLITLLCSSLLFCLFLLGYDLIPIFLHIDSYLALLALSSAFLTVFVQLNLDYARIQEKVSIYGMLSCSYALVNFLFSLYLVIHEGYNWKGRIYAQVLCDLLFAVVAIFYFYRKRVLTLCTEWNRYKKILLWSIPLIPHLASNWMRQGLDRYIIDYSYPVSEVGIFSFALNLASVITMIGIAFNATNSVNLYKILAAKMNKNEKREMLRNEEKKLIALYAICTLVIVVSISLLVPIILPRYSPSIPYFWLLAIYGLLHCIYFVYCNYLFYFNKTKEIMYITFSSSLLHLCLSIFFTRISLYFTASIYIFSYATMVYFVKRKTQTIIL